MSAPDPAPPPPHPGSNAAGTASVAPAAELVVDPDALAGAAGPGYAREWALFCDYAAATDQPALPTTVAALTGFLTTRPPGRRRWRGGCGRFAAAHRHTGHLLTGPPPPRRRRRGGDPIPG